MLLHRRRGGDPHRVLDLPDGRGIRTAPDELQDPVTCRNDLAHAATVTDRRTPVHPTAVPFSPLFPINTFRLDPRHRCTGVLEYEYGNERREPSGSSGTRTARRSANAARSSRSDRR